MKKLTLVLLPLLVLAAGASSKGPAPHSNATSPFDARLNDSSSGHTSGRTKMSATLTPRGTETDNAAIQDLFRRYRETIEKNDGEGWLALWTDDGVQMPPESPALSGRDAIAGGNVDFIRQYDSKFGYIKADEIQIIGDWAYARGTYTVSSTPKAGGEAIKVDGKFLSILKRQPDGSWKLHRDCYNSNR